MNTLLTALATPPVSQNATTASLLTVILLSFARTVTRLVPPARMLVQLETSSSVLPVLLAIPSSTQGIKSASPSVASATTLFLAPLKRLVIPAPSHAKTVREVLSTASSATQLAQPLVSSSWKLSYLVETSKREALATRSALLGTT